MASFLSQLNETWAYYSLYHAGWFCRTCQEYSNSHDQYWKAVPRTHNQHPGVFFSEHENCQNTLELSLIKVTSRNYWLKGHCLSDKQRSWIKDSQGNNKQLKFNQKVY